MSLQSYISEYYSNPMMTKTENTTEYSIYMAKNNSLLGNTHRYIIAMVPRDVYFVGYTTPLGALQWVVFQCRSIPVKHSVKTFSYLPKKVYPFNTELILGSRESEYATYYSKNFPNLRVFIFSKPEDVITLPSKGAINSALETWNTILKIES